MSKAQTERFFKNIHATCVCWQNKGVLLLGKSGGGKSDLALRLIENKNAILVADDRVDLFTDGKTVSASAPKVLQRLMEVRGIGIIKKEFMAKTTIDLVVELAENPVDIERMPPEERFWEISGQKIPFFSVYPFECSAPDKVVIKLKALLD